jgi:GNAT superfamily N-acetyltransferase
MDPVIRPLTPDLWPAFEDLFGRGGASNGCWCMYWRIGSQYHQRDRRLNRDAFHEIVAQGPPPGLLAFDGERAVGWCQLTPRLNLPWLVRRPFFERLDDLPVWSISCFYIRRGYRRQGVMAALIAEAVRVARQAGAAALEAYPVDTSQPGSTRNLFTGTVSAFAKAGFTNRGGLLPPSAGKRYESSKPVARRIPSHLIMRHDLKE